MTRARCVNDFHVRPLSERFRSSSSYRGRPFGWGARTSCRAMATSSSPLSVRDLPCRLISSGDGSEVLSVCVTARFLWFYIRIRACIELALTLF